MTDAVGVEMSVVNGVVATRDGVSTGRPVGAATATSRLMEFLPEAAGPHDPILVTIERPPGSVRRTTNIDTTRPDGLRGDAMVDGRARDVRTNPDGTTDVVGEAWLRARVSPDAEAPVDRDVTRCTRLAAIAGRLGGIGLSFPRQRGAARGRGSHAE